MIDYDKLFDSIGMIANAKIENKQIDKTIICTIYDISQRDYGKYGVTYNTVNFTANGENPTYEIGDQVYVCLLGGEYSNAYIISKKITTINNKKTQNPLDDLISLKTEKVLTKVEKRYDSTVSTPIVVNLADPTSYQYLGISAEFSAKCRTILTGSYGLVAHITTRETTADGLEYYNIQTLRLDSNNFATSNPYNTYGYIKQAAIFKIDINKIVDSIVLDLYYTNDDFGLNDIIEVNNIKLDFGFLKSDLQLNSIMLYTPNDLKYTNTTLTKTINALWTNAENEVLTFQTNADDFPVDATIIWKERIDNGEWTEVDNNENNFPLRLETTLKKYTAQIEYKCQVSQQIFGLNFPTVIESNSIIFINSNVKNADLVTDLKLTTTRDKFSELYSPDGFILDLSQAGPYTITMTANLAIDAAELDDDIIFSGRWVSAVDDNLPSMINGPTQEENKNVTFNKDELIINKGVFSSAFVFQIDEFFDLIKKNNKVGFELDVKDNSMRLLQRDYVEIELEFSKLGTAKTDYALVLKMIDERSDNKRAIRPGETLNIEASLYNELGEKVEFDHDIKWEWQCQPIEDWDFRGTRYDNKNKNFIIDNFNSASGNIVNISANAEVAESEDIIVDGEIVERLFDLSYIIKASYEMYAEDEDIPKCIVVGYLPIAIDNTNDGNSFLSGPQTVVYDSSGGNPLYYKGNYHMYINGKTLDDTFVLQDSVQGYIYGNKNFYPKIIKTGVNDWGLSPNNIYMSDANTNYCVLVYDSAPEFANIPKFIQPILIYQINSFSSYVNDWDGSFKPDPENNVLMSARLGAGKKEEDGTFSGVLLGDWKEQMEDGSWDTINTGIYGYGHGKASYGFRDDGTAFIGKSGAGRISFDGNKGTIQSANFDGLNEDGTLKDNYGTSGSYWDLDDGKLIVNDGRFRGDIVAKHLTLEGDEDLTDYVNLENYIQYDNTISEEGSTETYTKISTNGLLTANNAIISGKIHANQGNIGGWDISQSMLYQDGVGMQSGKDNIIDVKKSSAYFVPLGQTSGQSNLSLFSGAYNTYSTYTQSYIIQAQDWDNNLQKFKCSCQLPLELLLNQFIIISQDLSIELQDSNNEYKEVYPSYWDWWFYKFEVKQEIIWNEENNTIDFYISSPKNNEFGQIYEYPLEGKNIRVKFTYIQFATSVDELKSAADKAHFIVLQDGTTYIDTLYSKDAIGANKITNNPNISSILQFQSPKIITNITRGASINIQKIYDKSLIDEDDSMYGLNINTEYLFVNNDKTGAMKQCCGATGWARPEVHMFTYYINGICVGALDYTNKAIPTDKDGARLYKDTDGAYKYKQENSSVNDIYWERFINRAQSFYTRSIQRNASESFYERPSANNYPLDQCLYEKYEILENVEGIVTVTGYKYKIFKVVAKGAVVTGDYCHVWEDITKTSTNFVESVDSEGYAYDPKFLEYGITLYRDRSYFEGENITTSQWICLEHMYGD